MRAQTQAYTDSHGKKDEVLEKLEKLSKIEEKLPQGAGRILQKKINFAQVTYFNLSCAILGKKLIENAEKLSAVVIENTDSEGADKLKQDAKNLETEWHDINKLVEDNEDTLSKCVVAWDNYNTVLKALTDWQNSTLQKVYFYISGCVIFENFASFNKFVTIFRWTRSATET